MWQKAGISLDAQVLYQTARDYFAAGHTLDVPGRVAALKALKAAIERHEGALYGALLADFNKPPFDTFSTEYLMVMGEVDEAIRHTAKWSRPRRAAAGLANFPAKARVYPQPLGVALIMSPWNYPFLLSMAPLIGAVAAGDCVILRPSAQTPHTAKVMGDIISEAFNPGHVCLAVGDHALSDALLAQPFDFFFFTGSQAVGKHVMEAAARGPTPVILELGGKSPCIIHESADLKHTARRIAWGKFVNAGQTCIAPDYLLVQRTVMEPFLNELRAQIETMYYENGTLGPFPALISQRHLDAALELMQGETLFMGGQATPDTTILEPTVLTGVTWDSPIMEHEIFAPILPVLEYAVPEEAIAQINARPKPLALYLFARDKDVIDDTLLHTSSGGGCINDVLMHISSPSLPFGGVGGSGFGKYHGKYSFDAFSNLRAILRKSPSLELELRYPPHGPDKIAKTKRLLGMK